MSRQAKHPGLIRINKTGEMRLKNKVATAILKENTYEERALRTRLQAIKRHQDRNDRYLAHKQLEFATTQVTASEERPLTSGAAGLEAAGRDKSVSLPPIRESNRSTPVSKSAPELRKVSRELPGSGGAKGRWEKAISLVRHAVSQRGQRENRPPPSDEQLLALSSAADKTTTNLPPIDQAPSGGRARKKGIQRQVSLPEMIQTSRKKSQIGPQDPRFQRLEKCLQEGLSRKTETQGAAPQKRRTSKSHGVSTI